MLERLKRWVLDLLLVPATPSIPAGSSAAWVFRAAPNYYRYRLTLWALKQLAVAIGLVVGLVAISIVIVNVPSPLAVLGLKTIEVLAWLAFLVQLPFSFAVLNLDFELRWYIVADRSLRIREGILSLREKTMTFANIQNIEIRKNPLQRYLGIADVRVRTAGGGDGHGQGGGQIGESMHEAFFRGVDDPDQIRATIAERVRLHRGSGLGDPDDVGDEARPARAAQPVVAAARELHREMTLLRAAWDR